MKAGFAAIDITPPLGTRKIGWIRVIHGDSVRDPLYARAAVFESGGARLALIQLDTLSIRWNDTKDIRARIEKQYGFPGNEIMVTATHNHAGPAVASIGDVPREPVYVETMVQKIVSVFGQALEAREEAELGFGSKAEFRVGFNRRVIMRDGVVRTHGQFSDPNALCLEGPTDPEVAVIAARNRQGKLLGVIVNFACHPADHGGDGVFSAGWPGVLADELKAAGVPHTLFINGAQGNIATSDPARLSAPNTMESCGRMVAEDVKAVLPTLKWRNEVKLAVASTTVTLPFRTVSEAEIAGTSRGTQRFIDPKLYDKNMPAVLKQMKERGAQKAEVQVLSLDEYACVGIPAEMFVELGLMIKERANPKHALVFGLANGMVGYVPHKEAFLRGGYEATFCGWSKLAPEAGDMLVNAASELIDNNK
jgi:neutral ceramidase